MVTSWRSPPPAVPCKARPTTKIFMLCASAQMIEEARNMATAIKSIIFRPHMSESLAHKGALAAFAKRYAPPTQEYPDADCSSDEMVGIAVATMVMSRAATKSEHWHARVHVSKNAHYQSINAN